MRRLSVPLVLLLFATACSSYEVNLSVQTPAIFASEPGGHEEAHVTRVVDGDTIVVEITGAVPGPGSGNTQIGQSYNVRLIGIDTPETVDPNSPVECFGKEASAATEALLEDTDVRLVKDVEETDRYDRLLRYVYIGDEMANARLVANGYAFAYTYPPSVRHSDLFIQLEREAREYDRGLWASDACPDLER